MRKTSKIRSRDKPPNNGRASRGEKEEDVAEIELSEKNVLSRGENRIVYDCGNFVIKKPVNWLGVVKNRAEWELYNGNSIAPYVMAKTEFTDKQLLKQEKLFSTIKVPKRYKSIESICRYFQRVADKDFNFNKLLSQRVGNVEIGKNAQGEWRLFDCENIENYTNFNIIENFRNRRV